MNTAEFDPPRDATWTIDVDCVIISDENDFEGQIVRLAAQQKQIKYRNYKIDLRKGEEIAPWYIKVDNSVKTPAMVTRDDVVLGAKNILRYMEANLGTFTLLDNQNDQVKRRYKLIEDWLKKWDVECFDKGHLQNANVFYRQCISWHQLKTIKQIEEVQENFPAVINNLNDKLTRISEGSVKYIQKRKHCHQDTKSEAVQILDQINKWLGESGAQYALGTDQYTMGDVVVTCMLSRMTANKKFFNDEIVKKRPKVNKYWKLMQKDREFDDAKLGNATAHWFFRTSNCFSLFLFFIGCLIVSGLILTIVHFSRDFDDDHWFWVWLGLGKRTNWRKYRRVEVPLTLLAIQIGTLILFSIVTAIYGFIGRYKLNRWIKDWEEKDIVVGNAIMGEPVAVVVEQAVRESDNRQHYNASNNKIHVQDIELTTATKMADAPEVHSP